MRRAALEKNRTKREWRWHWLMHVHYNKERVGVSAYVVDCPCDNQKGRYRKMKGRGCPVCRSGKGCKVGSRDVRAALRRADRKAVREQMEDNHG